MRLFKLFLALGLFVGIANASYAPEPLNDVNSQNMQVMESVEVLPLPPKPQNAPQRVYSIKNEYIPLIEKYAQGWGVSAVIMTEIIRCESGFNTNARNLNEREDSRGLVQINLKAHTSITIEQATDPDFAINFLAQHLSTGKAPQMWYTCHKRATIQ